MLPRGASVLVAVSGGQDSSALLHALWTLRNELDLHLHVAHLNHGFRGAEAESDAIFVRKLSESLGLPCTDESVDAPGVAKRMHRSKQEAARILRRSFLERTAAAVGATLIATGHTRDDRVETILWNVLRGTGIDGLTGIPYRSGSRIRPLLDVERDETAAYCARAGIPFREDASNLSPRYTRSRLRTELLPEIESYYNPEARSALLRLAALAEADTALLDALAEEALRTALLPAEDEGLALRADTLRSLPIALQRRVVRRAIERLAGSRDDFDFEKCERVLAALEPQERTVRFQLGLPTGNITVSRVGDRVELCRTPLRASRLPIEYRLEIPGEVLAHAFGLTVRAVRTGARTELEPGNGRRLLIHAGALRPPVVIRSRRPGDRIRPLGLGGSRKLQDILTDRKVPAEERDTIPVLADEEGIIWVIGHAISERARLGSVDSERVLIEVVPLDPMDPRQS